MVGQDATTILPVRHGHVPGIEPAKFRGRCEIQLTETHPAQTIVMVSHDSPDRALRPFLILAVIRIFHTSGDGMPPQ
jgi:hypothetical protein